MLTRLKIDGFKNLRSVDLRFGFFTCIAGQNGVGKSNLFDAIKFLSDLASMPIMNAATMVRGISAKSSNLGGLFFTGDDLSTDPVMEFEVEAVVPSRVRDDYGQDVNVGSTSLKYSLKLRLVRGNARAGLGDKIELLHESLIPRLRSEVSPTLRFDGHDAVSKRVKGTRATPLIETDGEDAGKRILLRSNRAGGDRAGAPQRVPLSTTRTVLSSVDSDVHVSHLAMKREFQSWKMLQLEPSSLRESDSYNSESIVSATGAHLPSALRRIDLNGDVAADVANLIRGVKSIEVIDNEVLQLRTLAVRLKDKLFPASALSDGTLRFIALSILAADPDRFGLICMEEPENGIHPTKIAEMVALVRRLADDPIELLADTDSTGLRQVIINTHSPVVLSSVEKEDVLFASPVHKGGTTSVEYLPCNSTWRHEPETRSVPVGDLQNFISGISATPRSAKHKHDLAQMVKPLPDMPLFREH